MINAVILTGAGTPAIDGTYEWATGVSVGYNTGSGTPTDGYRHTNGTYIIVSVGGGGGLWYIYDIPNGDLQYESSLSGTGDPIGSFLKGFGIADDPAPTSTAASSNTQSVFVGITNNRARILKSGNNFYIRGVDIQ